MCIEADQGEIADFQAGRCDFKLARRQRLPIHEIGLDAFFRQAQIFNRDAAAVAGSAGTIAGASFGGYGAVGQRQYGGGAEIRLRRLERQIGKLDLHIG